MRILLYLWPVLVLLQWSSCVLSEGSPGDRPAHTNRLIDTNSPYLLQHAHNPVDWHPWGDSALQKAAEEDKMLLISIGYAACHWCHVMEEESFEDTTVARIMNEHFVPIKVDREERPDIDGIYMTACQLASNSSCGWPLNAFALPDGRPVWAGTYFPKKQWIEILQYFIELRRSSPDKLEQYADQLANGLKTLEIVPPVTPPPSLEPEAAAGPVGRFLESFDWENGGKQAYQKFPMPNNYEWLLQYHERTGHTDALRAVQVTLDRMAQGGIYDQIGGGFARYTVDPEWKVPHFEKMLYDNAQLVSLYAHAYQATGAARYRTIVEESLAFIERELTAPNGGFYSSLDADSEGEEGKYYVWTQTELDDILSPEENELVRRYFQTSEGGNWEEGRNILHRRESLATVASELAIDTDAASSRLASAKSKLLRARSGRVRPGLDDKILCSWNGLMLKACADAFRATGNPAYRRAALRNAEFLAENLLRADGGLFRNYKDGKRTINAFLDDYAHTIAAFLALYEITFQTSWLERADRLAEFAIAHFRDEQSGLFFYTSDLDPPLLVRKIELEDNVIPASNSSMARALFRLGHYYYQKDYRKIAREMMNVQYAATIEGEQPDFYSNWNQLFLELAHPFYEVAIVGPDYEPIRSQLQAELLPQAIFLGGKDEGTLPLLQGKLVEGATYVYVCLDRVCKLPVQTADAARELIR